MKPVSAMPARVWACLLMAWLIALVSTLGALFFSGVMGLEPCVLCWYQRIAMFPLVLMLGMGLYLQDPRSGFYALPLAVVGWLVALYHCLLYGGDVDGNVKLFTEVLGFTLVERVKLEDGKTDLGVWLTCSAKAHDIAFVRHAEDNKLHHVSFQMPSWESVLRAADIMSVSRTSIDIGPTRHGITQGTTIYFFDPSGNRLETFAGGYDHYPDMHPITWSWEEVGRGIFYHDRKLNDAFLSVVT